MAALLWLAASPPAQRWFYGWDESVENAPYDGDSRSYRVRYTPAPGGYRAGGQPSWMHGYPVAEQNLLRIMREISLLDAQVDEANVLTLDDLQPFRYPIA